MDARWGAGGRRGDPGSLAQPLRAARLSTIAVFVATGTAIGAWASAIPVFKARLGLGDTALGFLLLCFAAGAVMSMRASGPLARRWGERRLTAGSALLLALLLPCPALAGTAPGMFAAALALGAANGLTDVAMNALASRIEQAASRPMMSSFHAGFSAGGLLGALLGACLAGLGPGGTAPLEAAAPVALGAAIWCWSGADVRRAAGEGAVSPAAAPRRARATASTLPVLPLAAFACFLCEGAIGDWGGVALTTLDGASARFASFGYGAFAAAMVGGRLAGDIVSARVPRGTVIGGGGVLATLGFALTALSSSAALALPGLALVGAGLANVVPALFSAAAERGPSPAHAIARTASAGYAGMLLGPPMIGALAGAAGLRASLLLLALLGVVLLGLGRRV